MSQPSAKPSDTPKVVAADWLSADIAVAAGQVVDNVVIFPIVSKAQQDVGEIVTLDDAIARGQAEVRELGASSGSGAEVGALVINNRGDARDKEVRATAAENANEYRASPKAYGSKTMLKAAAPGAPAAVLSSDYVAK